MADLLPAIEQVASTLSDWLASADTQHTLVTLGDEAGFLVRSLLNLADAFVFVGAGSEINLGCRLLECHSILR